MKQLQQVRRLQRATARYGLFVFYWLYARLPYRIVYILSKTLLGIGYRLIIRQRKLAKESLRIAFGQQKTPGEVREIMERCFKNLGWGMIEMIYFLSHPELVSQKVSLKGREYLEEALAKGKGVVAVTAHFGNFPLMMLYFAQQGYRTNAIIRPARDQKLEKFLLKKVESKRKNTEKEIFLTS